MKKKFLFGMGVALCLSSCYCDKVTVGTIQHGEKLVHVASERNGHFLGGLMVTHNYAEQKIPGVENFVVENKRTFWDGVVSSMTFGLYTPSTTKYYVPESNPRVVVEKKKFGSKAYKGYLKN